MITALWARRLIDGRGGQTIEEAMVLLEDNLILAAGPATQVVIPSQAEIVDLGNQTLLPGFIDAHTHLSIIPGLGTSPAR